jgi:hypothetical protein
MVFLRIVAPGRLAGDAFLVSVESRSNNAVGAIIERVTPHCSCGALYEKKDEPGRASAAGAAVVENQAKIRKPEEGCAPP